MSSFAVSTVYADDIALLGHNTSANIAKRRGSRIYTETARDGLIVPVMKSYDNLRFEMLVFISKPK